MENDIHAYNWNFGDGNITNSTQENPIHTYYNTGSYTVSLTVQNSTGYLHTTTKPGFITVGDFAPTASFTSFVNTGSAPLVTQFLDTSENNPTGWNWSFDDGTGYYTTDPARKNVSHIFSTARVYNVTLTASNPVGSSTAFQFVTATSNPPPSNTGPTEYTSAGTFNYTSPAGMNAINITIVGAGGGGGGGTYDSVSGTSNGGFGGNASQVRNLSQFVSPGSMVTVRVGAKGTGGQNHCGQVPGDPGNNGGNSRVFNVIAAGGPGGLGGEYSPTSSHPDGYPGQNGFGTGQYATSGISGIGTGGTGGTGRGAGGGCSNYGGSGANGYIRIEPVNLPSVLASFTANTTSGTAPLTVRFNDTSTGSSSGWSWDFGDGGTSTESDPSHTYTANGTYTVNLTATNAGGSNKTTKRNYLCIGGCLDNIGVFNNGSWQVDNNANFVWDGSDRSFSFGSAGNIPVSGDWNHDGFIEAGVFNGGTWYLDYNGNGIYDGSVTDRSFGFGSSTDNPVTGDWNGDGEDEIGVELNGIWAIDYNGNGIWDGVPADKFAALGQAGDTPVIADWDGDGADEIGSYKDGFWAVDYNGNYQWDGITDDRFAGFGGTGVIPVTGDWNGDGKDEIGSEKDGFWSADYNGNFVWDNTPGDRFAGLGYAGDRPAVGDWNSNGLDEIASFKDGFWAIDYTGNYQWDGEGTGPGTDRFVALGGPGCVPMTGRW